MIDFSGDWRRKAGLDTIRCPDGRRVSAHGCRVFRTRVEDLIEAGSPAVRRYACLCCEIFEKGDEP